MKVIDLCSGLGGFSQAFLDRGHEVIRIDNDSRFKDVPFTIIEDIRNIRDLNIGDVDVMLMSPPCNHFSVASVYLHWDNGIPKNNGTVYALRIVAWCLDAVDYLKPRYWVIENPRGMLRKILGKPRITTYWASWGALYYKPTDLWGRFPSNMIWPHPKDWIKTPRGSSDGVQGSMIHKGAGSGRGGKDMRPSDSALRAKIPYELSTALCIAIEDEIGEHARDSIPCI